MNRLIQGRVLLKSVASNALKSNQWRTIATTINRPQSTGPDGAPQHYDIIIVGGGMVGTALACALGKNSRLQDKRILLLEAAPGFKEPSAEQYSNRVSAISKGTYRLMQSIGAWEEIERTRVKPVLKMQVWDACSDALITFNYDDLSENISWIVENDVLLASVYRQLQSVPSVEIRYASKLASCELIRDGAEKSTVQLASGERLCCDLLVGADGYNSLVRRQMGVHNFTLAYNQMGVVATLRLAPPRTADNVTAWQRFLPTGPIALLPLNDEMSSLVWSTGVAEAKQLLQLDATAFASAVNAAFNKPVPHNSLVDDVMKSVHTLIKTTTGGQRFESAPVVEAEVPNSRAAFPLGLGHTSTYVGQGVCLIGDAAHRVHPLAGQGVNLGFGDVQALTDMLASANYAGLGVNNLNELVRYEQQRLKHNLPVLLTTHSLQRLYTTDFVPTVALRSIGLTLTNALPPVKKFLMNFAMS
ncbi:ubiquinone biosynthesis monooxygenase COQ6, mitochondrial [Anopheles ziemanni]|uniref:ubiquinone biosynthesis monooxygenase COQ6, mitochondrial n=1 Tax=Anopheles coustani TaxID=139045 RepID=UPI00265AA6A2|nr:ubiquinone biosynthesis monooxygenase COQ6, mitochondrial [Anopheles coustani]XP_058176353.1 ubiquinone biosynthesis monooxygenase COQ6, mitochondrial [Anopheles ziemanni]